jgi:hypothetical protein
MGAEYWELARSVESARVGGRRFVFEALLSTVQEDKSLAL